MGKINEQQSTREIEITKYEEAANKFTSLSTPNVTLKYFKHQNNSKIRLYEKNISSVSSLGPTALKVSEKYSINPLKSKSKISLNDYYYSLKKNIIYGINGLEEKNNSIVKSIFFRKIPKTIEEFLPSAMSTRTYQELADENTNSALIFRGATIDSYHHYLNIYKTNEGLKLSYQVEDPKEAQHNKRYYKINDSTVLSSATPNDISTTEISYLIEYLKLNYNNEFISQVLMILENIYNQIQNPTLYNKEKETFKDINLLNDSFLTIKQKLTENLNEYIDEITSEYIAVNRNKQLTYKNNKN